MRRAVVTAAALGVGSVLLLSACSSPKASTATTTSGPTTTEVQAAACSPSSVTASVDYTTFGGSATAPAGAVVFTDTASSSSCSLHGVPTVQLVGADNQVIPTFQAPSAPAPAVTAVLTPKDVLPGKDAASSVTWSSLTCKAGSFSLAIRFPGWSSSVAAGSTAGYSGPPCTAPGQTVYVSPVEAVSSSASSTTTSSGTAG